MIAKMGETVHVIMWNNLDTTDYMRERIAEKAGIIETGLISMKTSHGTVLPPGPALRTCGLRNDDTIVWGIGGGVIRSRSASRFGCSTVANCPARRCPHDGVIVPQPTSPERGAGW